MNQTKRALALPTRGLVFDLTQPISFKSPRLSMMSPYSLCMWSHPTASRRSQENEGARNGIGFADERVETDLHIGTHLDALGHTWIGEEGFNKAAVLDVVTNQGLTQLGIENVPPLITRGVLIDLAGPRPLDVGHVVSPDDLEAALRKASLSLEPGDIVLIRTGWGQHYGGNNQTYVEASPGIGVEAATWLADHRVSVVGADTMGLEIYPPEDSSSPWAAHQELLVRRGVYILENANLEAIASAGYASFLCICLPIRFQGGTASPIRLVAVV